MAKGYKNKQLFLVQNKLIPTQFRDSTRQSTTFHTAYVKKKIASFFCIFQVMQLINPRD